MIYIYTLSPKSNPNDIKYIGKTNNIKARLYKHTCNYDLKESNLKNNWIKSVVNKGDKIHIEIIDILNDNDDWQFWETFWIFQFKSWGFKLKNSTHGGEGFYLLSREVIEKRNITNRLNKKPVSDETRKKISKGKLGDLHTQETKDKISKSLTGKKASSATKEILSKMRTGSGNTFYGKTHDNDALLKMSLNHPFRKVIIQYDINGNQINQFTSIGEAAKILDLQKRHIITCCKKINLNCTVGGFIFRYENDLFDYVPYVPHNIKPVLQYDTQMNLIKEFNSIKEATEELNIKSKSTITACCKGTLKTAYGFIWKYKINFY